MFDRFSELSSGLPGGGDGSVEADPEPLRDLLRDDEELVHVLANSGAIELTRDGRTTTFESGRDHGAFALITDERVLYVLGDQLDEAQVAVELTTFQASHVRKGLLNSKLVVKTPEESVVFNPDEGDLEAAEDYVDRIGSCWSEMEIALSRARDGIEAFEEACAAGDNPQERVLGVKSQLSQARRCATRDDGAPTAKMRSRIDDVAAELDRARVTAWLDRAEDEFETVESAREDGRFGEACEAFVDAAEAVANAGDALEDVPSRPEGAGDKHAVLAEQVDDLGEALLADAMAACESGMDAHDPGGAADAWETAVERYDAAVDAGWDGYAGVSGEALKFQRTWAVTNFLETARAHGSALESEGDAAEDDDAARERYEAATEWFERARDVAADRSRRSADADEAALDRLEEKELESSGWEFGAN